MKFAKNFFNDETAKLAKNIHYFGFVKHAFYKFLEGINQKPNW